MGNKTNWYVLYTAPRAEKKVYQELTLRGYEVFLPMSKRLKIWKNRQRKEVEVPLLPGYIFINTLEFELHNVKRCPKVVTYIHCAGKPSIVPLKDIEGIKKILTLDQEISIETKFDEGEEVRIVYGPLSGYEGVLIKRNGKTRFGIQLKEINQAVLIDICTSVLERV